MSGNDVKVNLFAAAKAAAGSTTLTVAAGTLGEVIGQLVAHSPAMAKVVPQCSFLVDGLVAHSPVDTLVPAGSEVDVLPPFAGG